MNRSEQINELMAALSKAQGEMTGAAKDGLNPHFGSKYSKIEHVIGAVRIVFAKYGLGFTQPTRITENGNLILETIIGHSSGQWIGGEYPVKPLKEGPQELGKVLTYARRYALQSLAGVPSMDDAEDRDDDGDSAMGRGPQPNRPVAQPIQRPVAQNQRPQQPVVKPVVNQVAKRPTFDEMDAPPGYMK